MCEAEGGLWNRHRPSQYLYNKILASVASPPGSSKIDAAETAIRYRLYECAVRRKSLHVAKRVV
jgi:hypothetical protein